MGARRLMRDSGQADRVALIPGGARGIGRAVAHALAAQAWHVAVCYRTSAEAGALTLADIERSGGKGDACVCDVSQPEQAEAWVRRIEQRWGRIDALINCVGPYHRVPLLEETPTDWQAMFDNNLHPVFYLSRAVAPGMRERRRGHIINFGMANADQCVGQTQVTAHYIAKIGVLALTRALARELAPHGITVNAISPGFLDSGSSEPHELERMRKRIPAGYIGSVDDAVAVVRFLLSDDARYVNGANVHLSGAWGI